MADVNEHIRKVAFGGKGLGMLSSGLGQVLNNKDFIDFQRKFVTPHNTVISMSNVKNPEAIIKSIKDKIIQRYPECTSS
jgi:predicted Zn-dependent peptidase